MPTENPKATVETATYRSFRSHYVTSGDTLQSVALNEMGSVEAWPFLAMVNHLNGNDDLVVGQMLFIPSESGDTTSTPVSEYIMHGSGPSESGVPLSSPYGTDIRITNGAISMGESSDFRTVSGLENVIQAVNLRLSTPLGMLLKHTAYGLKTQVGMAGDVLAQSYLIMALRMALMQDPRVQAVTNLSFSFAESALTISFNLVARGVPQNIPLSVVVGPLQKKCSSNYLLGSPAMVTP